MGDGLGDYFVTVICNRSATAQRQRLPRNLKSTTVTQTPAVGPSIAWGGGELDLLPRRQGDLRVRLGLGCVQARRVSPPPPLTALSIVKSTSGSDYAESAHTLVQGSVACLSVIAVQLSGIRSLVFTRTT